MLRVQTRDFPVQAPLQPLNTQSGYPGAAPATAVRVTTVPVLYSTSLPTPAEGLAPALPRQISCPLSACNATTVPSVPATVKIAPLEGVDRPGPDRGVASSKRVRHGISPFGEDRPRAGQ